MADDLTPPDPADLPRRACPDCGTVLAATDLRWRCCDHPLRLADPIPMPDHADLATGPLSLRRYAASLRVPRPWWERVTLGEGLTPLVPADPGRRLAVKVEYASPTLSFKDRGAVMLLAAALAAGAHRILADSSGNAGTAAAAYAARAGLPASIYVPEHTSAKKLGQIRAHGAELHVVPGTRDDCAAAAAEAAGAPGVFYASHVYNPLFHVGTATYAFEVWEQLGRRLPDTFLLPVGNGTLVLGVAHACRTLLAAGAISRLPRLVAVQSEHCAPLAAGWRAGHRDLLPVTPTRTLAEGIAIAAPARAAEILDAVAEFDGDLHTVTDDEVRQARADLARRGWYVEDTAAVCWAAAARLQPDAGTTPLGDTVVPLSGAGLKTAWTVGD